jgi:aspartyl protease family protein
MLRKLVIFSVCAASSASVPVLYQSNPQAFERLLHMASGMRSEPQPPPPTGPQPGATGPVSQQPLGRTVSVQADSRGHFLATFRINGRSVDAMVDTGATMVALNLSTARRVGISLRPADFRHAVDTANGTVKVALVELASLQLGRIAVERVQAVVLEDTALSTNLIGMTFLSRLGKYQVQDGTLLLVQ